MTTEEEDTRASASAVRVDDNEYFDPDDNGGDADSTAASTSSEFLLEHLETDSENSEFADAHDNHGKWYGQPLSQEQAMDLCPASPLQGLKWTSELVPEKWWTSDDSDDAKRVPKKGLNPRNFDIEGLRIKPHRGSLPLTHKDLLSSLTETSDGRFIFHGVLNGWPMLNVLELVSLERKFLLPFNKAQYAPFWKPSNGFPKLQEKSFYRATFRGPGWTAIGWSEASPGHCFWFESRNSPPRFSYGTNMLHTINTTDRVSHVHMVSHRYATLKESARDKLTYHSVVLLEWEHGEYCTVVEGAYLNGIGGYKCKSNWYEDKADPNNLLCQYCPEELVGPWIATRTEIRCFDVPQKTLSEFFQFMERHKGNMARFVDPQVTFSHVARLTYRSKRDVAQYLLNYISRDCSYQELRKNCQTLAADLCAFLAGKKNVEPFHPLIKFEYRNRTHQFLYDSNMYTNNKKKK